jgi:S-adenosylmethionine/arginine decarboxylase-like enzyme
VFLPRTFVAFVVVGSAVAAFSFGRYGGAQLLRQRGGFSPTENAASSPVSHYAFFPFDTSQVIRSTFVPLTTEESEKEEGQEEENLLCRKLFMDLNKVNASFLGSRECLARAVQEFSKRSVLPLVYLHSHEHSAGWSLVAALENSSRLTVVTWPDSGMMAIDVVACATDLQQHTLLPLIPLFQETFGVPRDPSEPVSVRWGQIQRGLKEDESNPESTEIDRTLNQVDIDKTFVASVQTKFQRIDVYDLIEPKFRRTVENHRRSLSGDGSYESQHPEFFRKDRVIYLDHVMQSRTFGEAAYHEPLVHPALFAHDNPKRVAIVGGGEGATLREVLKHSTVEKCVMIEIDEAMVNVSRQYIPDWSDCSDLQGSTDSCFDDPRAEVYYEDAIAWFINRFLREEDFTGEDRFDVIIMDAL